MSLTLLAALAFGALRVLADCGVGVFDRRVRLGTVEARADLLAALGIAALAPLALHVVCLVDQGVPVRALEGVTVHRI